MPSPHIKLLCDETDSDALHHGSARRILVNANANESLRFERKDKCERCRQHNHSTVLGRMNFTLPWTLYVSTEFSFNTTIQKLNSRNLDVRLE